MSKTGVAEMFWQSIVPNLSALPPITDLDESVALLKVTYPTLITLSRLWHSETPKRMELLDKVVRDGFIQAMLFSSDKLKVVDVEFDSLNLLIEEMGIYFVKHLKVRLTYHTLIGSMSPRLSHLFSQIPLRAIIPRNSSRLSGPSNS